MAIYWILHKPLSQTDWQSDIEGYPGYFYEHLPMLSFWYISELSIMTEIKNKLKYKNIKPFDTNKLEKSRYVIVKKSNLIKLIKSTRESDIFVFHNFIDVASDILLRKLNKYQRKTVLLAHWHTPYPAAPHVITNRKLRNKQQLQRFIQRDKTIYLLSILNEIRKKYYMIIKQEKPNIDYLLSYGNYITNKLSENFCIKNIIPVHSVPYDDWLFLSQYSQSTSERIENSPFYVYIDQALTVHPDSYFCTKNDTMIFGKEVNESLSFLENKLNTEIIVAVHPRCQFQEGFWGERKVYIGETRRLIQQADGVIGHFSTIMALAFLEKKKCIFLYSSSPYFRWIQKVKTVCSCLNGTLFDMNTLDYTTEKDTDLTYQGGGVDFLTLLPDSKKNNKEIIYDFLKEKI